ncbi:radical SAM protein [Candidatus Woesearchaeota archaeon]|nr:radical SAM protein [Candidatus Woesearchaeota archaeon]
MTVTILDCYTDEPAGLGVPPYLGTYPRYIAGHLDKIPIYITIDDLRLFNQLQQHKLGCRWGRDVGKKSNLQKKTKALWAGKLNKSLKPSQKTNIKTYNLTKNFKNIKQILENTAELIIIAGVHTPGKYLSAVPGTLKEIIQLTKDLNCKKILTGPAVYGTSTEGGRFFERVNLKNFDQIKDFDFSYEEIKDFAVKGAEIIKQIPDLRIIELETSKGCSRAKHCSFCTEPLKHRISFRQKQDIIKEVNAFNKLGVKYFRLGKQSCYYSHPQAIDIIKDIKKQINPKVLHIDNVNPINVITKKGQEITKAIVKYCTEGNIAAFGVESFDPTVVKQNNLNSDSETTYKAVKILNKYGKKRGFTGMQKFLPGINILFGLIGENKTTNEYNINWLKRFLKEDLLIRRINIRQVDIFEGTPIYNIVGNKFIKKNKKYYWKWRNQIRQEIDFPMLKKLVPKETILKDVKTEIYDGKTTFARQIGTYSLIIGIKQRLELNKFIDVRIIDHMLRSVVGEVI